MRNISLIFILLCLFSFTIEAQHADQCKRSLQFATNYYKQNNFRACIRTLNERCFTKDNVGNDQNVKKSYKIKIESLKKIDYDFEAEDLYEKFEKWIRRNNSVYLSTAQIQDIYNRIPTS